MENKLMSKKKLQAVNTILECNQFSVPQFQQKPYFSWRKLKDTFHLAWFCFIVLQVYILFTLFLTELIAL